MVLGFESDECLGADEADQRASSRPGCPAGKSASAARAGEQSAATNRAIADSQSNELHEKSTGFALRPFDGRPAGGPAFAGSRRFRSAAFSGFDGSGNRPGAIRHLAPPAVPRRPRRLAVRPAWRPAGGHYLSKAEGFRGLRLRRGPCRPMPPSYMRLTVAISRAFDRLGVWIGAPSGPSQPAAKRRI